MHVPIEVAKPVIYAIESAIYAIESAVYAINSSLESTHSLAEPFQTDVEPIQPPLHPVETIFGHASLRFAGRRPSTSLEVVPGGVRDDTSSRDGPKEQSVCRTKFPTN
jgi:hypothetical protein